MLQRGEPGPGEPAGPRCSVVARGFLCVFQRRRGGGVPSLYPLNAENAAQGGFGSPSATGLLQSSSLCPFCCLELPGVGGRKS